MMATENLVTVCPGIYQVHLGVGDLPGSVVCDVHTIDCPAWCMAANLATGRPGKGVPTVAKGSTTVDRRCIVPHLPGTTVVPSHPAHQAAVADWKARKQPDHEEEVTRSHAQDDLAARDGITALLRLMGEDPTRPGLRDTPARVVKAYMEMTDRPGEPDQLLARIFAELDEDGTGEMITVRGIEFVSVCEHHLLPFTGTATVAYIPSGTGVVGLSKIPRLVHHYARRPQVQERLVKQITSALDGFVPTNGSACRIEATHQCMSLRGVRAQGAAMVTTSLTGRFLENAATRAEFLAEAGRS
jgi:GTP cyclohydrolase I